MIKIINVMYVLSKKNQQRKNGIIMVPVGYILQQNYESWRWGKTEEVKLQNARIENFLHSMIQRFTFSHINLQGEAK